MKKVKSPTAKRLDGKKILVSLTARMEDDMRQYRRDKGIESENELVRQAIAKYLDSEYDDDTLKLSGLKDIRESLARLHDMISVLFSFLNMMHISLLAYHPEIPETERKAAYASASTRHEKFFESVRERIKNDSPFFEKLLHVYMTGNIDE